MQNIDAILARARSAGFHLQSREQVLNRNELTTEPIAIGGANNPVYIAYYSKKANQLYPIEGKLIQNAEIVGVINERVTSTHHWRRITEIIVTKEKQPKTYIITNINYQPKDATEHHPAGYFYTIGGELLPTGKEREISMKITVLNQYEIESKERIRHSCHVESENSTTKWGEIINQKIEGAQRVTGISIQETRQAENTYIS